MGKKKKITATENKTPNVEAGKIKNGGDGVIHFFAEDFRFF